MPQRLPITRAQAPKQKVYHCLAANVYAASAPAPGGHSGRPCGCKAEKRSERLLTKEKMLQTKRCQLILVPGDCAGGRDHHYDAAWS